jgi:signal peptidase I
MSQENISINLKMVSVPALPARDFREYFPPAARTRAQARAFNFGRFIIQLFVLAVVACLSFGCYLAVSRYIVQTIEVVGESMVPTLQPGHHYILNRWAYHDAEPARGDVVVIRDPADHGISVKRIIALSGESVHFVDGKVIVNGHTLNEPYLKGGTYTFTYAQAHEEFFTCGKDQYFLLGDNRPVSIDSRAYGPVTREDILGRVSMDK